MVFYFGYSLVRVTEVYTRHCSIPTKSEVPSTTDTKQMGSQKCEAQQTRGSWILEVEENKLRKWEDEV